MLRSVYLALGAREGAPRAQMLDGVRRLAAAGMEPAEVSSLWETEPVDLPPGPPVLNAALRGVTLLPPREVLRVCLEAEQEAGRRRGEGERRTLDLDILLVDDLVLDEEGLTLPHPRFHRRRFNLAPLAEIAPEVRHPVLGATVRELLEKCPDHAWARVLERGWARGLAGTAGRLRDRLPVR